MGAEGGETTTIDDLLEGGQLFSKLSGEGELSDGIAKLVRQYGDTVLEPKSDGASLLHTFARRGCYEAVRLLWERGARPSVMAADGSTLLHSAVADSSRDQQRARIISLFLNGRAERGEDHAISLDHCNKKGWTTLKLAARRGLEQCIEVLLNNGANPDISDDEHYLPLHNAVGYHSSLKLLLSHTQNINKQTLAGETALFIAVEHNSVDCALTLLEHSANPNITNKEGISPLFLAARGGNVELVRELLRKGANPNAVGAAQQIGPLHWAAHKEHTEIALLLIKYKADIQLKDKEGRTPLSMASPDLVSKMLEAAKQFHPHLNMSCPSPTEAPFSAEQKAMIACSGGNNQALQNLLHSGVDVNYASGTTNSTLLHMAAYCGQVAVVVMLLNNGADWRLRDKDGDTVLHFACMKQSPQGNPDATLEYLLSMPAGSLINVQNSRGDTPLLVAVRHQSMSRAMLLLQAEADTTIKNNKNELPIHRACCNDQNIEIIMYLVDLLPNVNVQDADGWTPLMYAARSKCLTIVKYLLQRRANPNLQQSNGFTALHLAAQENQVKICSLLLKYGCDPNVLAGPQKLTPLHMAAHKGLKEVCYTLVEQGADFSIKDNDGDTAIELAVQPEIRQAILCAHAKHCAGLRVESNSRSSHSPTNSPTASNFLNYHQTKEEDEKLISLQTELEVKSELLKKMVLDMKMWRSSNEQLELRVKGLEEEIKRRDLSSHIDKSTIDADGLGKRWWLLNKEEITDVSEEIINADSKEYQRFFNVRKGKFRTMKVAFKEFRNSPKWDETVFKTFLKEMEMLSRMQCPHVVQFIGACVNYQAHDIHLVTEFLPGGNLYDLVHVSKVPLDDLKRVRLVHDMVAGMAFLHSFPVIHRHLVPRNILITGCLRAKISDFGFVETKIQSNFYKDIRRQCTKSDTIKPPVYFAPEVIEKNQYSTASDVYSFSMCLYELVTSKRPFSDMEAGHGGCRYVMKLLLGARPQIPDTVTPECQKVMTDSWHNNPSMRPTFQTLLEKVSAKLEKCEAKALASPECQDNV